MNAKLRYVVVAAVMLLTWAYLQNHHDIPTPLNAPLSAFPGTAGEWHMVKDSYFDQETLKLLRPTEYMAKRFARADGVIADLYVGYHDGARQAGPLHSPKNCLPGSGWYEVSTQQMVLPVSGESLNAARAVYQQGAQAELFIYWFQVAGKTLSNEYVLKLHEVLNSIRNGRRDAAFIRISVPVTGSEEQATAQAEDFLKAVRPALKQFLPS